MGTVAVILVAILGIALLVELILREGWCWSTRRDKKGEGL